MKKSVDNLTVFYDRGLDATIRRCPNCDRALMYEIGVGPVKCECGGDNPPKEARDGDPAKAKVSGPKGWFQKWFVQKSDRK